MIEVIRYPICHPLNPHNHSESKTKKFHRVKLIRCKYFVLIYLSRIKDHADAELRICYNPPGLHRALHTPAADAAVPEL